MRASKCITMGSSTEKADIRRGCQVQFSSFLDRCEHYDLDFDPKMLSTQQKGHAQHARGESHKSKARAPSARAAGVKVSEVWDRPAGSRLVSSWCGLVSSQQSSLVAYPCMRDRRRRPRWLRQGGCARQGEKYATRPISELDVSTWEVRAQPAAARLPPTQAALSCAMPPRAACR